MISLQRESLDRLDKIVKNGISNYIVFSNNNFYGSFCTEGASAYCDISHIMINQHYSDKLPVDQIQKFIDQFVFISAETKNRIQFKLT